MKKIQRIVFYLFSFTFARGILFFSPILLANLLPSRAYGMVEWAYAAASLAATIAGIGIGATIPLVEFKKTQSGTLAGVLTHYVCLVSGCMILLSVALLWGSDDVLLLTTLFVATIALQSLWSTYLKTHGKGESALIVEAGVFLLMTLAVIAAKYFHVVDALLWVLWTVAGCALCLYGVTVVALIKCLRKGEAVAYRAVLALGFPLMIAGLVTVAATTSGRLVIGYLGGALLTADYAILARAAALPMVAHQVVMVAKFRHMFTLSDNEIEKMLVLIFGIVALSVVAFGSLFPVFGWIFGPVFVKTFNDYPLPTLWILAQSVLWSAIAVHDLINARHHSTREVLPWSIGFLLVSAPVAIVLINYIGVSLEHFVYVHGLWMLLFYLNQIQAMYRAGIRLMRAWALAVGSYVSLITLASLLYY
jgi:O-antigen/teichoic acid export membrane protein